MQARLPTVVLFRLQVIETLQRNVFCFHPIVAGLLYISLLSGKLKILDVKGADT